MATRRMTLKYWATLEEDSKRRALTHVFPGNAPLVRILLTEKPDKDNTLWQIVFREVKIPDESSHCKTVVHKTYIP